MYVSEPIAPAANTSSRSGLLSQLFLLLVLLLVVLFVAGCRSTDPQPSTEAGVAGSSALTLSSAGLRTANFPRSSPVMAPTILRRLHGPSHRQQPRAWF